MGLDDLFKNKYHHKNGYRDDHGRYHDHDDHYHGHGGYRSNGNYHHGSYKTQLILSILKSLPHKKGLLIGLVLAGLLVIILGLLVLWAMIPIIAGLLGAVDIKGLQDLVVAILNLVQKFASGG